MVKKFLYLIIKILSWIPFFKLIIKTIYTHVQNKIKENFTNHQDILDIILTSNIKSKDFIFGQSDLNFLIIVNNDCHPKNVLNSFRDYIDNYFLLSLTVNTIYIPILTESELKTDVIKSFLLRKSFNDIIRWHSILTDKIYTFHLRKQDHFAIAYNSIQNLDYYLLKDDLYKPNRAQVKNLYESISNLRKFYPNYITKSDTWRRSAKNLQRFPQLSIFNLNQFIKRAWGLITEYQDDLPRHTSFEDFPVPIEFIKYMRSILMIEFIDDFTFTPTIIQQNSKNIAGKLYIDIHVNQKTTQNSYIKQLENLRIGIRKFETKQLKFKIRLTTPFLYKIQNEFALYPFPLEGLYRKERTFSVGKVKYDYIISHEHLVFSSIHFLTTQFMRFRSLQQKTDLIGSKFIKALNLMYRYYLLSEYLKGKEFKLELNESKIREHLTPQFSGIKIQDTVTDEQWIIIKAQLKHLLKEIRDELVKYDASLKLLRF